MTTLRAILFNTGISIDIEACRGRYHLLRVNLLTFVQKIKIFMHSCMHMIN